MSELPRCTICHARACSQPPGRKRYPDFCPSVLHPSVLEEVREMYLSDQRTRRLALAAARTEAAGYGRTTRIEDTIVFARGIGARRLGIASWVGLLREAAILAEIAGGLVSVRCPVWAHLLPSEQAHGDSSLGAFF